jgi:hypothetical protein
MNEIALVAIVFGIITLLVMARRHRSTWPGPLHRLHAGVQDKAEWMASEEVVSTVEAHYLAAQHWASDVLLSGNTRFLSEASYYYTGNYLKRQHKIASQYMQTVKSGVRFMGVLRAEHTLRVRHFSDDGLRCLIVDYQTDRHMLTYEYWRLKHTHNQSLTPAAYVFRMVYDRAAHRWKIEDLVQRLPRGWEEKIMYDTALRLDDTLPIAAGRDT